MNRYSRSKRIVFLMLALLSIVAEIVACSSLKPTEKELVGLWIEDSRYCQGISNCGTIQMNADGSFEAYNISEDCFGYVSTSGNSRINGRGTWQLKTGEDVLSSPQIDLHFDANPQIGTPAYHSTIYSTLGKDNNLYCWVKDESDSIYFRRNKNSTPTPSAFRDHSQPRSRL